MLNQIVLVGRLTETPKLEEGKCFVTLAVPRAYKNDKGEYETDFISITLAGGIAENIIKYCKKSDLIGVKGRLQTIDDKLIVVVDKVTFLSPKRD